jgi:hypothetical protein
MKRLIRRCAQAARAKRACRQHRRDEQAAPELRRTGNGTERRGIQPEPGIAR